MATMTLTSHPSRVRGLKSFYKHHRGLQKMVAPFTGAWIEIIQRLICSSPPSASHPSRVRGLKSVLAELEVVIPDVAPFTGAWIEILY